MGKERRGERRGGGGEEGEEQVGGGRELRGNKREVVSRKASTSRNLLSLLMWKAGEQGSIQLEVLPVHSSWPRLPYLT